MEFIEFVINTFNFWFLYGIIQKKPLPSFNLHMQYFICSIISFGSSIVSYFRHLPVITGFSFEEDTFFKGLKL